MVGNWRNRETDTQTSNYHSWSIIFSFSILPSIQLVNGGIKFDWWAISSVYEPFGARFCVPVTELLFRMGSIGDVKGVRGTILKNRWIILENPHKVGKNLRETLEEKNGGKSHRISNNRRIPSNRFQTSKRIPKESLRIGSDWNVSKIRFIDQPVHFDLSSH